METLTIVGVERAEGSPAQPHRLFQHRVEHRRQIAGRGVDDLQHLGGRGLLLQRLALFGDQPRVLDRDHRLIGEGADEFDLPVGERLDPLAREHDDSNRFTFAQQRHAKRGPLLAQPDRSRRDSPERRPRREYARRGPRARPCAPTVGESGSSGIAPAL